MVMSAVLLGTAVGVSGFAVAQFASAAGPSGSVDAFVALAPARILDTRFGVGATAQPLGPNSSLDLLVTNNGGVPNDATAVVINITVEGPTEQSYLTAWPKGAARPTASNLNWVAGRTIANLATVKIGDSGQISIYNFAGNVNVIADVAGYYHSVQLDDRYYTKTQVDQLIVAGNNFNPNLYYTKTESDARFGRQFFGSFSSGGTQIAGNATGNATHVNSSGAYTVPFASSLASCAATATIADGSPGLISAAISGNNVNVNTWTPATSGSVTGNVTITGTANGTVSVPGQNAPVTGTATVVTAPGSASVTGTAVVAPQPNLGVSVPATGLSGTIASGTASLAAAAADHAFNLTVMCS